MFTFERLDVWQKAISFADLVYSLPRSFPTDERFGLTNKMRRAAVSIPSNIAEGQARRTTGEFVQFVSYAEGSVAELDTQLHLSIQLSLITAQQADPCFHLLDDLRRMLNGLRRKLSPPA